MREYGWRVYVVRCSDGTLYTGISTDVRLRIAAHNKGQGARYTRTRLPVVLKAVSSLMTHREALRAERSVKKLHKSVKVQTVECL